jgi:hypothetical protein
MYRRFLVVALATIFIVQLNAQNFSPAAFQHSDWKLLEIPTGINMAMSYEYAYSFEKSVLYIGQNEAIVSVWHSALGHALIRVDNEAKVKWKSAVPGYILGTAKWKNNVIAFCTKEWNYKEYGYSPLKEVIAAVYDPETGKKVKEKVVYVNETKKFVEPIIHSNEDGQFGQLLVRQTSYSGKGIKDKWASTAINVISLNDDLVPSSSGLQSEALNGEYLGSLLNNKGETLVVSYSGNKVVVEKFKADYKTASKLETPGTYEHKGMIMRINDKNDQSIFIAMTERGNHKIELALYEFDFIGNKVASSNQTLHKESVKTWKAQNKEEKERVIDFKDVDNLKLACLLQTDDKVIAVLEERYTRFDNDGKMSGTTIGPVVILFFGRKLNLLNSQAIAKEFDIDSRYLMEWTIGCHMYEGKLLLVTNDGVKQRTASATINTIDLNTMKAIQPFYVEKGGRGAEGAATLWFNKNFILTNGIGPSYRKISF